MSRIDWSDDSKGANVVATDGGVSNWATIPADADLEEVAADYLRGYDISGIDEAGEVTVTVTRLDEDGDAMGGTPGMWARATRKHDDAGRWIGRIEFH